MVHGGQGAGQAGQQIVGQTDAPLRGMSRHPQLRGNLIGDRPVPTTELIQPADHAHLCGLQHRDDGLCRGDPLDHVDVGKTDDLARGGQDKSDGSPGIDHEAILPL